MSERNLSKNTQKSYRDTFRLIVPVLSEKNKKSIDKLLVNDMTDDIVKAFL